VTVPTGAPADGPAGGSAEPDHRAVRVVLVTRVGCHLCEAARVVVSEVCDDLGVGWDEVDVDTADLAPGRREEWSDQVPVTLVDGRQHDFWRVDDRRLRAALATG
jgi:hypothetical protein